MSWKREKLHTLNVNLRIRFVKVLKPLAHHSVSPVTLTAEPRAKTVYSNLSGSTLSVESERCGKLRWSGKTGKRGIWERRRAYCGASVHAQRTRACAQQCLKMVVASYAPQDSARALLISCSLLRSAAASILLADALSS